MQYFFFCTQHPRDGLRDGCIVCVCVFFLHFLFYPFFILLFSSLFSFVFFDFPHCLPPKSKKKCLPESSSHLETPTHTPTHTPSPHHNNIPTPPPNPLRQRHYRMFPLNRAVPSSVCGASAGEGEGGEGERRGGNKGEGKGWLFLCDQWFVRQRKREENQRLPQRGRGEGKKG